MSLENRFTTKCLCAIEKHKILNWKSQNPGKTFEPPHINSGTKLSSNKHSSDQLLHIWEYKIVIYVVIYEAANMFDVLGYFIMKA